MIISGVFTVKALPQESHLKSSHGMVFRRLGVEKDYSGELVATGHCELLSINTPTEGSAAYVALEHITGYVCGRYGSFVTQETASLYLGEESNIQTVVADSGTGELSGLTGTLHTKREGEQYYYEFDFDFKTESITKLNQNLINDEDKDRQMESMLGPEFVTSWFAIHSLENGGLVDLHFYPNGIMGTGIATKQLTHYTELFPMNDVFTLYELVMFTRESLHPDMDEASKHRFIKEFGAISTILNVYAPYCIQNKVNPCDIIEVPASVEDLGGKCLLFVEYHALKGKMKQSFGMMLIMEIYHSEMAYAKRNGSKKLIDRLKLHEHYPYFGLDRPPVV